MIKTNLIQQYQELGLYLNSKSDLFHAMCWFQQDSLKKPLQQAYPDHKINHILTKYRKFEKRWILRQKINEKFHIFKNIKFSKYFRS